MQTLSQRMAKHAYRSVDGVKAQGKAFTDKYGTMAHKLPILIRQAGLAQALAFVEARGEVAHHQLLTHIAQALELPDIADGEALAAESREASLDSYILLTQRVLRALVWYKRFVESILKVKDARDQPKEGQDAT